MTHWARRNLVGAWCPSVSGWGGTLLRDLSGNGNHGTLTNMDPATDWVTASGGHGVRFGSATNEHVSVPFGLTNSEGSICATFMSETQVHFGYITGHFNSGNRIYIVYANGSIQTALGNTNPLLQTTLNSSGIMYHVVLTWSGGASGTGQMFQDGKLVGSSAYSGLNTLLNTIPVGNIALLNSPFIGVVYDVRFYSRVISESEARLLYNGGPGYGLRPERRRKYYFATSSTVIPKFVHHYRQQGVA